MAMPMPSLLHSPGGMPMGQRPPWMAYPQPGMFPGQPVYPAPHLPMHAPAPQVVLSSAPLPRSVPAPPGYHAAAPPPSAPSPPPAPTVYEPTGNEKLVVFVGKLAVGVSDMLIRSLLDTMGTVVSWKRQKVFGFCEFQSIDNVRRALRLLNGFTVCGQPILVKVDEKIQRVLDVDEERQRAKRQEEGIDEAARQKEEEDQDRKLSLKMRWIIENPDKPLKDMDIGDNDVVQMQQRKEEERERAKLQREKAREAEFSRLEQAWIAREQEKEKERQREHERDEKYQKLVDADLQRLVLSEAYHSDEEDKRRVPPFESREFSSWKKRMAREREEDRAFLANEARQEEARQRALRQMQEKAAEAAARAAAAAEEREREERERAEKLLEQSKLALTDLVVAPLSMSTHAHREAQAAEDSHHHQPPAKKQKLDIFGPDHEQDEDTRSGKKKLTLKPIEYTADELRAAGIDPVKLEEQKKQQRAAKLKALADRIPTQKEQLFDFPVDWALIEQNDLIEKKMREWVAKKVESYLGTREAALISFIIDLVKRRQPQALATELAEVLDEEAQIFVAKLWRTLIFEALCLAEFPDGLK
eukprot:TRINITY_DN1302_c0_g1_i1.p1 TRINITY_DN1302_c0_g1~~TRINITY_DN1302_c0_g1_i1.p1  ORF type:complete len:633 (+),score=156.71 TRINITY_DN1302_c0_g1_i1:140-1900(+)